ncbi:MAG TPA: hypothetical protein VGQ22_17175 [Steroidobacteraceae bacterium]|nr:hypothetical protein [Steroidobacteraceae bacterium]
MPEPFTTPIQSSATELIGPLRAPRQMLAAQKYDDHTSIHDNETAQKFGFKGGTIEGPTHFSQFVPLCVALWGSRWFAEGSLSAHYRNACFEGEKVRAFVTQPQDEATQTTIRMEREDGTEILRGTAAVGGNNPPSALEQRISELKPPEVCVILRDVHVGMRTKRIAVRMDATQHMGALYPFSLAQKLAAITELSPWYTAEGAASSPFKRAIIPMEMVSVLLNYSGEAAALAVRKPVVGLFADQEIRMHRGPLFVGEPYEMDREVVALSGSRRTESLWIRTRVFQPGREDVLATMLLNAAYMKDSYPNYEEEWKRSQAKA